MYKVKKDHRSSLYYAQYEWCVTLDISLAHCLRRLQTVKFESAIQNAKYWSDQDRFSVDFRSWSTSNENDVRKIRDVLLAETAPFKTVISFDVMSIYTNRAGLAKQLHDFSNDNVVLRHVRQVVVSKPAGVIRLHKSKYAYRTYFRERKYTRDQRNMLKNFLDSRQDSLRVSSALSTWINGNVGYMLNYARSHYFVDHDHANEGTMLSLVLPGIVRKTLPIETTK